MCGEVPSTASPPSEFVTTNRDKHNCFCARFAAADKNIMLQVDIYLAEQLDVGRRDRT